jgi:hypothetical protein
MKLLLEKAKKHIKEQNETYLQHMCAAWKIIYLLKKMEIKCFIHSIFPFLYTQAVSEKIECLQKMIKRDKNETPT